MNTKIYQSGLKFMLCNAVKRLYNGEVIFHHSLDKGIYATIVCNELIGKNELERIKKCMQQMAEQDIPFNKKEVSKEEAYNFFMKKGYVEKAKNILYISNVTVSLFEFEGQYNYFYSHDMPKSSSELKIFDLYYISDNELVLIYPTNGVIEFEFRHKIYEAFHKYDMWLNLLGIDFVSDVNKIVATGRIQDLIKKNDISVDNNLYDIAREIRDKKKKIVLISGPSSSGKTTTSKKLALYLSSMGINSLPLSLDDFFVDRDMTPLDDEGKPDYECLEAIDLALFNDTLDKLLNGEIVKIPRYNFIHGVKEYDDREYAISTEDVLVIEGLHALNPNLLNTIDKELCYKVYISPLTPLNVDRHNYVSTTDNRLLRRIVRDFRTNRYTYRASLASWASVRAGEEKYIFPYTDTADAILNTAYIYEIGVLKVYVEPLLYSIGIESPYYYDARRLLDSLRTFYAIPSEYVGSDNLLREFIGNSSFEE